MTLTPICLWILLDGPALLLVGIYTLCLIFNPPYADWIVFIDMMIIIAILILLAAWAVSLNYGVETLYENPFLQ